MRGLRALLVLATLASCGDDVGGVPMAINDPLALIDDIEGPLRLFVLPAEMYSCDATTGFVTPEVPDVAEGMVVDAIADVSLQVSGSRASEMLTVPIGSYTVLVRGKGTDPVTGRTNVFIATACQDTTIENGATREVRLTLLPIVGMGVCGDGVFSPDEQCEDSNMADGDGCSAACRTEPFPVNTTVAGVQNHPSAAGAPGRRYVFSWDTTNTDTFVRLLEPSGAAISVPSALTNDADLDAVFTSEAAGTELLSDVAMAASGRVALAYSEFTGGVPHVQVGFFSQDRVPEAASATAGAATGTTDAAVAFAGDGSLLVAFSDTASATGLSARVFAPGSTTPLGAGSFEVGTGTTGGSGAVVAGASDHFAVAFTAGGDIYVQRFGLDGAARDAAAVVVADGPATQDQPALAAQPDGRLLVAWRGEGDSAGSAVRARAFAADGTAADPITVNTTTAGDQGGPAIGAGGGFFAVAFTSAGSVRGRVLSADGAPLPNRDQPPTTADFAISSSGSEVRVAIGGPSGTLRWLAVWNEGDDIRARPFALP